jgi:energy-coupling factor transporter ATP-binding protein EcfA2
VLVLDEPTSNLDPVGKEEVFSVAARLNQEHEMTIVIVEHEVEVIASYADRVIIMDGGSIVSSGSARAVFTDVDNLRRVGVRPPQVTQIASGLTKRGYSFSTFPVTLEEAETEFSGWEQRKKAAN